MESAPFKPKRGSLLNAVETSLGHFVDHSQETIKLVAISKSEFHVGDPLIIPFQTGATDDCYALKLVFCDDGDELGVGVHNYAVSREKIEKWADELWGLWERAARDGSI